MGFGQRVGAARRRPPSAASPDVPPSLGPKKQASKLLHGPLVSW
jgi:hypothetical protein